MTREQAQEIAQEAAKLHGRDWEALPPHSREIWIEAARTNEPWLNKPEQPEEIEADEPTTKKRGKK